MSMFDDLDAVDTKANDAYPEEGKYLIELLEIKQFNSKRDAAPTMIIRYKVLDVLNTFTGRSLTSPKGVSYPLAASNRAGDVCAHILAMRAPIPVSAVKEEIANFFRALEQCIPEEARLTNQGKTLAEAATAYLGDTLAGVQMVLDVAYDDERVTEKGKKPFAKKSYRHVPPENQAAA